MRFLAAAFVCIFLFIVKGGLPGPVCFALFVGYCIYDIAKERDTNIKRREFKTEMEERHLKKKEKLKAEYEAVENGDLSLSKHLETVRDFVNETPRRIKKSKSLRELFAREEKMTSDGKDIITEINALDATIRESIANATISLPIVENSASYGTTYLRPVCGKYELFYTKDLRKLYEENISGICANYTREMEEWRKANGR